MIIMLHINKHPVDEYAIVSAEWLGARRNDAGARAKQHTPLEEDLFAQLQTWLRFVNEGLAKEGRKP